MSGSSKTVLVPKKRTLLMERLRDFWYEYKKHKIGMLGLLLLSIFILIAVFSPVIAPVNPYYWRLTEYWQNNPQGVPPVWASSLIGKNLPYPENITSFSILNATWRYASGGGEISLPAVNASLEFDYPFDDYPDPASTVFSVTFSYSMNMGVQLYSIYIVRPDGLIIPIAEQKSFPQINATKTIQTATLKLYILNDLNINQVLSIWLQKHFNKTIRSENLIASTVIMGEQNHIGESNAPVLKGKYKIIVTFLDLASGVSGLVIDPNFKVESMNLLIGGKSYGLLGTDTLHRDLFMGIIWGVPIALMIGILTSLISVGIGIIYGVVSGYFGGKIDEIMMRIVDVLIAIPKLPILIAIAIVFRPSIWNIVFFIAAFGWMGIARVGRSVALQLKEVQFVEAAKAVGAGSTRIIMRHITPHLTPYAFANLALGVPDAILTEASLSFLGLGDPTLPTWGSILHDAEIYNAIGGNMWWWWVPPGLLIALISLSFVFIGHAIDEILNPRLRRL
ncbi:MAG: ABC transporter permease [Thermoprotei archaeon]|jgi:peptide/nickel transport system permease protein